MPQKKTWEKIPWKNSMGNAEKKSPRKTQEKFLLETGKKVQGKPGKKILWEMGENSMKIGKIPWERGKILGETGKIPWKTWGKKVKT